MGGGGCLFLLLIQLQFAPNKKGGISKETHAENYRIAIIVNVVAPVGW